MIDDADGQLVARKVERAQHAPSRLATKAEALEKLLRARVREPVVSQVERQQPTARRARGAAL